MREVEESRGRRIENFDISFSLDPRQDGNSITRVFLKIVGDVEISFDNPTEPSSVKEVNARDAILSIVMKRIGTDIVAVYPIAEYHRPLVEIIMPRAVGFGLIDRDDNSDRLVARGYDPLGVDEPGFLMLTELLNEASQGSRIIAQ